MFLEREEYNFVITYDYVTKEPLKEDPNDNSGDFAFNVADAYNYNPQQQYIPQQQPTPVFTGAPMNTPVNPYFQQQAQPQYYNNGFTGFVGNPYFLPQGGMSQPVGVYNPYFQQPMFFQQAPQPVKDQVVFVDGYSPYGKGLLPQGIEAQCDQLQMDMMLEQEKVMAEREKRIQGYYINNGYYNGYNYYGMPYMNTMDQGVYNRYIAQVQELTNQAIQRRSDFNKNISRLVHKIVGDDISEEEIDRIYDGYSYTIPGTKVQEYQIQDKLDRLVPVDNSAYYQQQFDNVSRMYRSLMPETDNLNEWLHNCGYLILEDKMENHIHNMKDASRFYTPDTFHMFLRRYAKENNIQKNQEQVVQDLKVGNINSLPTNRDEAARLLFGNQVAAEMASFREKLEGGYVPIGPPNQAGTPVVMTDELENEFELRRGAFVNSIFNNQNHAQQNAMKGVT